ncbi:spore germination protein [Paenibacillus sp. FSL R5-0766]|uniref:spore germination protein n=1 Tax=unclassified Paenibacillus TaxID=185978 RepID=UPI00096C84A9|nr:spore germination protein [Paenibacillus sp. FSL R5-0765]OMF61941.1 spore germination protein [Paenibacillus sp. FSL R5-0765]
MKKNAEQVQQEQFKRSEFLLNRKPNVPLSTQLNVNEQMLRERFDQCSDVVFRPVTLAKGNNVLLLFMDGLVDTNIIDLAILKPLFEAQNEEDLEEEHASQLIQSERLAMVRTRKVSTLSDVIQGVLNSSVVVIMDGHDTAMVANVEGAKTRSVEEPASEAVIRGPREGFNESLRVNTSMIRRKIKSDALKTESITIGDVTQTEVVITYIQGIAKESILDEVRTRLKNIKTDSILESGYIEEFIQDKIPSPFPTIQNTERPDTVAASLLEGKVAIITDGTPFVLIVPFTFWTGMQSAEDYYNPSLYSSAVRFIRIIFIFISLFLPSLFVAIVNFHSQMIPTSLALNFAAARENSPFPTVIETILMEILFEGLREAGIRLPKQVGSAVSIVGALVIGQAAVEAGIVSAPIVIVVAGTGIASFTIARLNLSHPLRMLRFVLLIFAGILGLYGIAIVTLATLLHITSLRSFGVPYFSPIAPLVRSDLKDAIWRSPRWRMYSRPEETAAAGSLRTPRGQAPGSREKGEGEA